MDVNEYQTPITDELLEKLPQEVTDQFWDYINNIPFIQNLISPKRLRAKDLPRDAKGRIVVNLTTPHVLENTDYFRPTALHYEKYGTLTDLRPNANPNSEFGKWLREERRRCWEGYVRESDGEWVTGYMYWYLNYCPIMLSKIREGSKRADRIVAMPEFWEGVYWRFHYLEQASIAGKHCAELASRSKALWAWQEVETPTGRKRWYEMEVGDTLFAPDGRETIIKHIPFRGTADIYAVTVEDGRIVYASEDHEWIVRVEDRWVLTTTKEIIKLMARSECVYLPRPKAVQCIMRPTSIPPYIFGLYLGLGRIQSHYGQELFFRIREDKAEYYKEQIKKRELELTRTQHVQPIWSVYCGIDVDTALRKLQCNWKRQEDSFIPDLYLHNSIKFRKELLRGILDSSSRITKGQGHVLIATHLSKFLERDIMWLLHSLGFDARATAEGVMTDLPEELYTKPHQVPLQAPKSDLRIRTIKFFKRASCMCVTVDRWDGMFLAGDFVPTHNSKSYTLASILSHIFILGENEQAHKKVTGVVTAYQKEFLTKDGVISKFVDMINFCGKNTQFPRKRLKDSLQEMTWTMGYKDSETGIEQGTLNTIIGVSANDDESKLRGKRAAKILVEEMGVFPKLIDLYNILLPSVQEGDIVFGQLYLLGTSGDSESDFAGAKELIYNPDGYNMYALPNVYDKSNQGRSKFVYFFPGYINRKGCYNKDGVSDVVKALIEILMNRYRVKYNSSDPNTITRTIAEIPVTPSEAVLKTSFNIFPVTDLNTRLLQLDSNPNEYNDVYVGDLTLDKSNKVVFVPSYKQPIRDFPHKDNKIEGAIEIFQMPELDKNLGIPFSNRYIGGVDPIDSDEADSLSLGSIFILDLWQDKIVAEYTGRPLYAEDFYEICRKLSIFYNAKLNYENNLKGLFAYFTSRNSGHMLADTLEFLKDKQLVKESYGNQSKGTHATLPINNYARNLLRTWLLAPIKLVQGEEEEGVTIHRLYTVRSRALIKELINYNSLGNFDRISAMGMLMLLREDRMILYQNDMSPERMQRASKHYLGNDPFFEKNYKNIKN